MGCTEVKVAIWSRVGFLDVCNYYSEILYLFYCNNFHFMTPVILLYWYFTLSKWGLGHLAWGPGSLIGCVIVSMSVGSVGDKEFVEWRNDYGLLTGFLCCVYVCY